MTLDNNISSTAEPISSESPLNPESNSSVRKIRNDYIALFIGIGVSLILTLVIWLLTPRLLELEATFVEDQGPAWYFWKLPERNDLIMLSVWILYAFHQVLIWATIYLAQKYRYTTSPTLKKLNYISLGINLFFIIAHIVHTQLFYDKTAQDAPIWTSQGSVILMLSVIIVMENPRRGIIFGKKANFKKDVIRFFRKYHGYYIAWALIYTFWFHPSVGHLAHIWGFLYMFLLLLQGSLMYTKIHMNKYWTVLLEVLVAFHGALVAVMQAQMQNTPLAQSMWPMFFLGFLGMFILGYMYGLGWPKWVHILITSLYILFMAWLYLPSPFGYGRPYMKLVSAEFLWIPIILFGIALVFGYIGNLLVKRTKTVENKE